MKANIHPQYQAIKIHCASCGSTFTTGSTLGADHQAEVCSNCHPVFTGQQRTLSTGGRIEKFRLKFAPPAAVA